MKFLLALLPLLVSAAVTVKRVETTATQAVIEYVAPSASACTLEVSEAAGYSPVVHDVNATLFSGANSDARSGNVTDGTSRTFVVGQRTSGTAADGLLYSRALQAATLHYYRITCGGDQATGTFRTQTPPLGNTAVEAPPFNADGFGNYAWPTIDWTDQSKSYIDPMTGVLVKLAHQPPGRQSNSEWGNDVEFAFAYYVDPNAAWTDAGNVLSKSTGGPFATYAGAAQDPLFVSFATILGSWTPAWGNTIDDIRLTLYGSGDNATADNRTMLACLSIDSQTCVSDEIEVVLPQTTAAAVDVPATYPQIQFNGWGSRFLRRNETSTLSGVVSTSGSTVTYVSGHLFSLDWAAGSKIYIADSGAACTNSLCTIASVTNARTLTVSETVGTLTSKAYKSAAWGVRLRKKTTTGSVSLNSSFAHAWSIAPAVPLSGTGDFCSSLTTTVSYAADGTTPITPTPGRLCVLRGPSGGESILTVLIDATGEMRLLSDFNFNSGWQLVPYGAFSQTDPLKLYFSAADNTGGSPRLALYEIEYDAATAKFATWAGDNYRLSAVPEDYLTWTNLTPYSSNRTINEQIAASITSNPFYKSAMGSSASFVGIVGNYAVYSLGFGGVQDSPCFVIRFDILTGDLVQIADTMGGFSTTGRWGGCHAVTATGAGDWVAASVNSLNGQSATSYMHGPFELRAISHVYKAGAWNADTSISGTHFYTCTPGNPYEAQGATGDWCLKLRVTGEPCSAYPTAAELADYPCSWDAAKSMPQTLQPGDYLWAINSDRNFDGKNEKMLVVSKTDIGGGAFELEVMRSATCRGVLYYDSPIHDNGWTAVMCGTGLCGGNAWWNDATGSSWYPEDGAISNAHGAFGSGLAADRYSMLVAGTSSRFDQAVPDQFGTPATFTQNQWESEFAGVNRQSGVDVQSYLNKGQWTAPASEQVWALDLRHYNPSFGGGSEIAVGPWAQTYSLVAGHTQTYLISINGSQTSGKIFPFLAWAGPSILLDKSGPGSTIGDADVWRYCVAYKANECITGSSAGDAFVNVPQATTSENCIVNQYSENYPCFTNGYWFGGWATQHDVSRNDPFTRRARRLTMGFTGPGRQYQFKNLHATPDGKWAFIESGWLDGVRDDMLLVKLPPWPAGDSVNRGVFVNVPVAIGPGSDKARIRFGYDSNFYCTSRAEACVTDTAVSPFAFVASDSLTPVTCSSGCTINVPAIAGRVLYYRIERLDAGGALVSQSGTNLVAIQ